MARIEKTVFISYRHKDIPWALLVYKDLNEHGFDVFFDYKNIASGDYEQVIIGNIKARAHFLVIFTPSALDRCNEPEDWLRREIETAINEKRNIIPLFFEGFDFGNPSVLKRLTGNLKMIDKYNGLNVPADYFEAAMENLRTKFLNIALDAVLHPVSDEVQEVVEKHKTAANEAIAQIINRGETNFITNGKFSGIDASTFQRIVRDVSKPTTGKIVDLQNVNTSVCAYCHKPFQLFEQRVICDFCGAQYHHIGAGHGICPPMNMKGVHVCVNCQQPIDTKKYRRF